LSSSTTLYDCQFFVFSTTPNFFQLFFTSSSSLVIINNSIRLPILCFFHNSKLFSTFFHQLIIACHHQQLYTIPNLYFLGIILIIIVNMRTTEYIMQIKQLYSPQGQFFLLNIFWRHNALANPAKQKC